MRDEPDQGASDRRVAVDLSRSGTPPRARYGPERLTIGGRA